MERHRDPEANAEGKVLEFAPPSSAQQDTTRLERTANRRRLRQLDLWSARAWLLMAWMVSACQLQRVVADRLVFNAVDSLAFLVAVVMPILRARNIITAFGEVARAVRRMRPRS